LIHLVQAAIDGVEAFDDFRITTGAVFVLDLDERREGDATLQQKPSEAKSGEDKYFPFHKLLISGSTLDSGS
jgi:hypothetical protein